MTAPVLPGDPAALRAVARTLATAAADLDRVRETVIGVRLGLAGSEWQGPAALAFSQAVWSVGLQYGTAADRLEASAAAVDRYANRLDEELATYHRAMADRRAHADALSTVETPGEEARLTVLRARADAAVLAAHEAARAEGERCAQILAEVADAAALPWRDWAGFTLAAIPEECFADMRLVSVWDRANRHALDPDRRVRPWFPPGSDVVGFDIPVLPGHGQVRMGFFIADAVARPLPIPCMPAVGDGDGRTFDPAMGPEDNRVYVEIDYEAGRAWVGAMPSCSNAREDNCTPAHQIDDSVHLRSHDSGAVEVEFSIGNSRVDGPVVNNLEISGHLAVIPAARGGVLLTGFRSPFPSFEAYHDVGGRTVVLAQRRQTRLGLPGLALPDPQLPPAGPEDRTQDRIA
jgi:hypothetical protein